MSSSEQAMQIKQVAIKDIQPYDNNPRKNDQTVDLLKRSISEFGFKVPVILDSKGVLIAGHTRVLAAKELGIKEVPAVIAEDLTEEQVRAFRILDNKVQEYSTWDYDKLATEMDAILESEYDILMTGFREDEIAFITDYDKEILNDGYKEWANSGSIDYESNDLTSIQSIKVHFETEKDRDKFAELVKQNITPKTKSIWFPEQEDDKVSDLEYVDEE